MKGDYWLCAFDFAPGSFCVTGLFGATFSDNGRGEIKCPNRKKQGLLFCRAENSARESIAGIAYSSNTNAITRATAKEKAAHTMSTIIATTEDRFTVISSLP